MCGYIIYSHILINNARASSCIEIETGLAKNRTQNGESLKNCLPTIKYALSP